MAYEISRKLSLGPNELAQLICTYLADRKMPSPPYISTVDSCKWSIDASGVTVEWTDLVEIPDERQT